MFKPLRKSFCYASCIGWAVMTVMPSLLVTACAVHGVWYVPHATVGHVTSFQCGTTGLNNKWVMKREGVILTAVVLPHPVGSDKAEIAIGLTIPKDRVVKSPLGDLRAYGSSGEELQANFIGGTTYYDPAGVAHYYKINEGVKVLKGSKFATKESPSTGYGFGLTLKEKLSPTLDVVLPHMEINGHEYPPLTIHFTKKTGTYFVTAINC